MQSSSLSFQIPIQPEVHTDLSPWFCTGPSGSERNRKDTTVEVMKEGREGPGHICVCGCIREREPTFYPWCLRTEVRRSDRWGHFSLEETELPRSFSGSWVWVTGPQSLHPVRDWPVRTKFLGIDLDPLSDREVIAWPTLYLVPIKTYFKLNVEVFFLLSSVRLLFLVTGNIGGTTVRRRKKGVSVHIVITCKPK